MHHAYPTQIAPSLKKKMMWEISQTPFSIVLLFASGCPAPTLPQKISRPQQCQRVLIS